ncbi:hypothetical protein [Alicyclobacillus dauci]|uniref:Spo0E like sporulation regulatory protein n=1 Tax=Alicyclobacillus dauci TaxID=1475485 RepID=A0ABY6Z4Z6_9BACL|nr:hypothetical protein [Alicyclobacillus dauci]WAH37271.1 hypothetical protein NZD86_01600 [Alicyclobacillus dauci]
MRISKEALQQLDALVDRARLDHGKPSEQDIVELGQTIARDLSSFLELIHQVELNLVAFQAECCSLEQAERYVSIMRDELSRGKYLISEVIHLADSSL